MSDAQSSTSTDRPPSPLRRQRACLPCSRAKARCNFSENDAASGCDRCRRMKIECAPQTTKVLRRPRQLKSNTSRAASVEKKIDGITSLLEASSSDFLPLSDPNELVGGDSPLGTPPSISTPDPFANHYSRSSFQPYGLNSFGQASHHFEPSSFAQPPTTTNYPHLPSLSYSGTSPGFGLTWGQAEQAISSFKIKFMPNFPFVALRPEIFGEQLYLEKPLLFKVIMLVAAPSTLAKQRDMKRSIMAYIGQHLMVSEERNLDLLQGLLVFIAWANLPFYIDRQITHLIYLTVGFAHNLGITRPPPSSTQKTKQVVNPGDVNDAIRGRRLTTTTESFHTLEEMRAFLGCYYVLSVNSSQFHRHNSLNSSYVDYCRNYITQSVDCWTDGNLEKMVRLQQVAERTAETFPIASTDIPQRSDKTYVYIMNHEMRPIREQADKICESFDRNQMQSATFWLHYNYALVRLYEPATWLSPSPTEQNSSFLRCQCLLYCLQAARSFFDAFLSSSAEELLSRCFVSSAELVSVMVTSSRLLLLDIDDWDRDIARQTLDLSAVLDQLITAFAGASLLWKQHALEGAGAAFGAPAVGVLRDDDIGEEGEDVFVKYIGKIKWIKLWFDSRVRAGLAPDDQGTGDDVLPDIWSLEENASNQFWLGVMGSSLWDIEF